MIRDYDVEDYIIKYLRQCESKDELNFMYDELLELVKEQYDIVSKEL